MLLTGVLEHGNVVWECDGKGEGLHPPGLNLRPPEQ